MSYRVRYTLPDGRTGHWMRNYATCEEAQKAIDDRHGDTGLAYYVEKVPSLEPKPEPTSTTERLVGLLRDRHAHGLAKYGTTLDRGDLTPDQWAQHAIEEALDMAGYLMRFKDGFAQEPGSTAAHHVEMLTKRVKELVSERVKELEEVQKAMSRDLSLALQLGDAMREAMRTGEWRAGHDRSMASSAIAGWDRWKTSLAASPQGTAKASEATGEGGDSGSSSFEALEAFLRADTHRSIQAIQDGRFVVSIPGLLGCPASRTLEGIAARVEEMTRSNAEWLKPISRPKDKSGEYTNRWRLNALERFLDGNEDASLTWWEGEFNAVAEDVVIQAPTLLDIADKLMEKKEAKP